MITRQFILAGRAIFTVANGRGERYTFKVIQVDTTHLASYLTGPDNTSNYQYLGTLSQLGTVTSRRPSDFKPLAVLQWAIRKIWDQCDLPVGYSIVHAGRCGRCGRLLTTPESVSSGFGPDCIQKI